MLDYGLTLLQYDLILTNYVYSDPVSKKVTFCGTGGLGFLHENLGGDTSQFITIAFCFSKEAFY